MSIDDKIAKKFFNGKLKKYSSSITQSMKVIDALQKLNNCCVKLQLDIPADMWEVTIKGNNYNCEVKGFGQHKSLAMAICKAALKSY